MLYFLILLSQQIGCIEKHTRNQQLLHIKKQILKIYMSEISIEQQIALFANNNTNETTTLPRIKYYWRQKVYKEEIFTKD